MNERSVVRYAGIGFAISMLVLAIKAAAWWTSGSVVLLADAAESGLDVVTALLLLAAVRYASQPPDREHPFGHDKAEYFSAGFQGALVFAAGIGVAIEAARSISTTREELELGIGLGLSILATACNIGLALLMIRAGRTLRSPALEADGRHNLADVVTTLGGWTGLALAWLTGWWLLDPLVALLVAAQILWTGATLARNAFTGLMDTALPDDELAELRGTLEALLDGQATVERLRTRRSARRVFVDCVLLVPGEMTVRASHDLCDRLEAAAEDALAGADLTIHVEPLP